MEGFCDRCCSLDLRAALSGLYSQQPDPDQIGADSLSASLPEDEWYVEIREIGSSPSCTLCALVLKGWRVSRAATVEDNLRFTDLVDTNNPPADFAKDILEIQSYSHDAIIEIKLISSRRKVEDGREHRSSIILQFTCTPARMFSFEANLPLVSEFRVLRHWGDDYWLDVDGAIHPDPLSTSSLDICSSWLSNCISQHGDICGQPLGVEVTKWPGLPSRILDVQPADSLGSIYLRGRDSIATDDRRYVALSHCWGKLEDPFCTTRDTLRERMERIDVAEMPSTFQDAVTITRRLGLRYLWIDSLCIIQGDREDWAKEAADMSNIYRYCHLLIGAARGASDAAGFLKTRAQSDVVVLGRQPFKDEISTDDGGIGTLHLQLLPPDTRRWTGGNWIDPISNEPLNGRAWCLQERVLPTRALFYGSTQAFWECRTLRASEDGDTITHMNIRLGQLCRTGQASSSVFSRDTAERDSRTEENSGDRKWVDWYKMVEEYSNRSLTKDDDRLVALGGLARFVARSTPATYLAGLWESGLIEGLMWSRASSSQQLGQPSTYSAPSWSWASIVGPIQFLMYSWYDRASWKAGYSNFERLADCVHHHVQPRMMEDQYGRLAVGCLILQAPLLSVAALRPRQETAISTSNFLDMEPDRSPIADKVLHLRYSQESIWIEGGFDRSSDAELPTSELFAVLLTRLPHVGSTDKISGRYRFLEHRFGLIVRKTGSGEFCRVGFIDGFVLQRRLYGLLAMFTGNREFENVSYASVPVSGDWEIDVPENLCAPDPLGIRSDRVVLC